MYYANILCRRGTDCSLPTRKLRARARRGHRPNREEYVVSLSHGVLRLIRFSRKRSAPATQEDIEKMFGTAQMAKAQMYTTLHCCIVIGEANTGIGAIGR